MKLVIQRVNQATVKVDKEVIGSIKKGFMILVGAEEGDNQATVNHLANKIAKLRVFEDENGKMNLNIHQINGKILSVSQFTLLAALEHGNRPSFKGAGDPIEAKLMYEAFNSALENENVEVQTGIFGADMQVELENDGPATFELNYQVK